MHFSEVVQRRTPPRVAILDAAFEPEMDDVTQPIEHVFRDAARRAVAESRSSIEVEWREQQFVVRVAELVGSDVARYAVCVVARGRRQPVVDAMDRFRLSAREAEVLWMIVQGATNAEIAAALHIVGRTVQDHVRQLCKKVGARRRGDLLAKVFGVYEDRDIGPRPAENLGDHSRLGASSGFRAQPLEVVPDGHF